MPPAPLAATYVVILLVVLERSFMLNWCVRDRMATDAPLVAMMGTEGEPLAAGNAVGLENDVTSRVVSFLTKKVQPLKKGILSSAE